MTGEIENLIVEMLKRVHSRLDAIQADLGDLKTRMSAIEHQFAQQAYQIAALNARMDRFDERLARIERRLDLVGAG